MNDLKKMFLLLKNPQLSFAQGLSLMARILLVQASTLILKELDGFSPMQFTMMVDGAEVSLIVIRQQDFDMLCRQAKNGRLGHLDQSGEVHLIGKEA